MISVVFVQSAERDLLHLKQYLIRQFGLSVWQSTFSQLCEAIEQLKTFPLAGKIPEELQELDLTQYRQIVSGKNRIIYEVQDQVVYVHIIYDARQEIKSLLMKRFFKA